MCAGVCTSGSEAPAPLKGLQRLLEAEQLERRLEAEAFLRRGGGGFALLGGEALLVNLWVGSLELKGGEHIQTAACLSSGPRLRPGDGGVHLLEPLLLVFGRKFLVGDEALQELRQRRLGSDHSLLLRLQLADLFAEGWRRAEVCV